MVWGLRFGVSGLELRVWNSVFEVSGVEVGV